jgi:hypothetical protein
VADASFSGARCVGAPFAGMYPDTDGFDRVDLSGAIPVDLDATLDRLADAVERHLDKARLLRRLGREPGPGPR